MTAACTARDSLDTGLMVTVPFTKKPIETLSTVKAEASSLVRFDDASRSAS
jgi:hypothetical protein